MLYIVLVAVAVLVIVFVAVVSTRPSHFRVERTGTIMAPASVVFDYVNDLHLWQQWSPWARLDPNAKGTYEGPPSGVGASYAWSGSRKIGEGTMTITESVPGQRVGIRLEFRKPFKGTNQALFDLTPEGEKTLLTWSMIGKSNFVFKAMGLFMDCDKMCGRQFEEGMANLNEVLASTAKVAV